MLKEMSFGCAEHFFSSSVFVPGCKQSLETGSKSSFSSITGFECLLISAFHPVRPLFMCSLPVAVSIFVPVVHSLRMN